MQSVSETKVAVRRPHMVGIGVPYIISFSSNQNIKREKAKENKRKKDTPPPPTPLNSNPSGRLLILLII